MIELIEQSLTYEKLGDHSKEDFSYRVISADLNSKDGVLKIKLRLNFVMPFLDGEKLKTLVKSQVPGLNKVQIEYEYDEIIQSHEEIVALIIENMVLSPSMRSPWLNSIKTGMFEIKGNTIEIQALGISATEALNSTMSKQLSKALNSKFSMEYNVVFLNNENLYAEAEEKKRELEQASILSTPKNIAIKQSVENKKKCSISKEGNRLIGRGKMGTLTMLSDIIEPEEAIDGGDSKNNSNSGAIITVEGIVFFVEARSIGKERQLVTMHITDKKTSVCAKLFVSDEVWEELSHEIKPGDCLKLLAEPKMDQYDKTMVLMVKALDRSTVKEREDNYEGLKRVELHAHTKMSAMDGLNTVENLIKTSARWGHPAVSITDHGVVQSFPDAAKEQSKLKKQGINIKIIYGVEGYVFDDRDCLNEDGTINYKKKDTNHIILIAKNQEGLKNIYKLVSFSHLDYFYKKPRMPKSIIEKYREGIIIGSACEAGEVYRGILAGLPDDELLKIAEFYDYLEIQPLINNRFLLEGNNKHVKIDIKDKSDIIKCNLKVVELADRLGKKVVATTDAHYDEPEAAIYRNILMAGMGFKDAERGQGLYMRTTEEMLEEFSYLGDRAYEVVVENTNYISDMVEEVRPVPKGKFPPKIPGADETLRESCMERAYSLYGNPLPEPIEERLEKELNSIISNGYAVMYVAAQMLVKKSLEDGYLVGSRGSVGSSFAATMAGITEVNPLEPHYICPECKHLEWGDMALYDCGVDMPDKTCPICGAQMNKDGFTIPFATFLGFNGDKEPDIDLNFAGEYQATAHKYVGEIFGEENVFKAGTVGTVKEKTAFGYVKKFFEQTQRPVNKYEINRLTMSCSGVKRTTGQHPGGIIIVPEGHEIYEFCPVQHPANDSTTDIITTHFDYHKIDENLLKLDILGHTIPSMIRQLQDFTGVDPIKVPLTDPKVLSIFNGVDALDIVDKDYKATHGSYAIPEFGTAFVRQMLDDTKPDKFADLVRISGFSHGTDVWLNNAKDYIKSGTATMREAISTRDDIMNYLILKGIDNKQSFDIMEKVRKNKTLTDEELEVMYSHGVPQWYVDSCIKIQYMFPRAHAVAYVMMSMRMAWYKVYYPKEFYATYFTSVAADFDTPTIMGGKLEIISKLEEIRLKSNNATQKEKDQVLVLEVALEMIARGYSFTAPALGVAEAFRFKVVDDKIMLSYIAAPGMGETAAKSFADAEAEKPFETIEEAVLRSKINKATVEGLKSLGVFDGLPETDQLSLF